MQWLDHATGTAIGYAVGTISSYTQIISYSVCRSEDIGCYYHRAFHFAVWFAVSVDSQLDVGQTYRFGLFPGSVETVQLNY